MKRVVNKFIDMMFYSKVFKMTRIYHYRMAYEQGKFDFQVDQQFVPKIENTYAIKKEVREQYMNLCPVSTSKCISLEEIDYKINRAIFLGNVVSTYPSIEIQYYNLRFTIDKNTYTVTNLLKNCEYYEISEYKKAKYDRKHNELSLQ